MSFMGARTSPDGIQTTRPGRAITRHGRPSGPRGKDDLPSADETRKVSRAEVASADRDTGACRCPAACRDRSASHPAAVGAGSSGPSGEPCPPSTWCADAPVDAAHGHGDVPGASFLASQTASYRHGRHHPTPTVRRCVRQPSIGCWLRVLALGPYVGGWVGMTVFRAVPHRAGSSKHGLTPRGMTVRSGRCTRDRCDVRPVCPSGRQEEGAGPLRGAFRRASRPDWRSAATRTLWTGERTVR
jgi:hypothetical protein